METKLRLIETLPEGVAEMVMLHRVSIPYRHVVGCKVGEFQTWLMTQMVFHANRLGLQGREIVEVRSQSEGFPGRDVYIEFWGAQSTVMMPVPAKLLETRKQMPS